MSDKSPEIRAGVEVFLHLYDREGGKHGPFVANGGVTWNAFERRFEMSLTSSDEWERRHAVRNEAKAESLMFGDPSPVNETPKQPLKEIAKDRVADYRQTKEMEYLRLRVQGIENRMTKFESEERSAAQILKMLDEFGNFLQRVEGDKEILKKQIDVLRGRLSQLVIDVGNLSHAHNNLNAQLNAPEPRTTKRKR
jgi:hypothetical protein